MNIVCFGDSNTFGYNPSNGFRYDKKTRWTGVLQNLLGKNFNIIEEGLTGRTTIFDDPYLPGRCALNDIVSILDLHKPVDLLIIMLGTNDTKEIFNADANDITKGLEILVNKAISTTYNFRNNKPEILIVSPFPIKPNIVNTSWINEMGENCWKKSYKLASKYEDLANDLGCYFFDAALYGESSDLDCIHLSKETHNILAHELYNVINNILNK